MERRGRWRHLEKRKKRSKAYWFPILILGDLKGFWFSLLFLNTPYSSQKGLSIWLTSWSRCAGAGKNKNAHRAWYEWRKGRRTTGVCSRYKGTPWGKYGLDIMLQNQEVSKQTYILAIRFVALLSLNTFCCRCTDTPAWGGCNIGEEMHNLWNLLQ